MTVLEILYKIYLIYFIYSFLTYKIHYSLIVIITVLINININILIKKYLNKLGKKYNHKIPVIGNLCRPIDKDCKKVNKLGYGTPSNHSQISSFIAAFYYFYYRNTKDYSMITTIFLSALAFFIMINRYTSKNHSISQIILGSALGISLAYICNIIIILFFT